MNLGTETGSLMNHIYSTGGQQPNITIGMGATVLAWTDRHAATVVSYDEKRKIVTVQRDHVKRIDNNGMSESQEYEYTPDTNGMKYSFKLKNDRWQQVHFSKKTNRWKLLKGEGLLLGTRRHYYDFSF